MCGLWRGLQLEVPHLLSLFFGCADDVVNLLHACQTQRQVCPFQKHPDAGRVITDPAPRELVMEAAAEREAVAQQAHGGDAGVALLLNPRQKARAQLLMVAVHALALFGPRHYVEEVLAAKGPERPGLRTGIQCLQQLDPMQEHADGRLVTPIHTGKAVEGLGTDGRDGETQLVGSAFHPLLTPFVVSQKSLECFFFVAPETCRGFLLSEAVLCLCFWS